MTNDAWKNTLYFGDNLPILRDHVADESVDLIYLDPPFNSKATYNVLFHEKSGAESAAQITAFEDTWHWGIESEDAYHEVVTSGGKLADLLGALRQFLGTNDMMAYLTMMAIRLKELHGVLKPTGSIYLHCDPTASHYLKLILDGILGAGGFRNEIIWHYGQRTAFHKKHLSRKHDVIFLYGKTDQAVLNPVGLPWAKDEFLAHRHDVKVDDAGREFIWTDGGRPGTRYKRFVDEVLAQGKPLDSVWNIPLLNSAAKERLGYPTQKPEALLERIIMASSNEGDVVLDPFCGCGTAIAVAERLHRRWIGIDITHLAVTLMKHRLHDTFGKDLSPYEVIGDPKDLAGAKALALQDRYQFEWWALGLVEAQPAQNKKKGADKGVDGLIYFIDNAEGKLKRILVQVKSGHVMRSQVSDLCHAVDRENAAIGLFITLEKPTRPMIEEAATAGFYEAKELGKKYPRLQILTIEELLNGKQPEYPRGAGRLTYKQAQRRRKKAKAQPSLLGE